MTELLAWFAVTHDLVVSGFGAYWRLAWLPGPGSVGEQDARMLNGLTIARQVYQAALVEDLQAQRGQAGLASWRERIRRQRG